MATYYENWGTYSTGNVDTVTSGVWDEVGALGSWLREIRTVAGTDSGQALVIEDDNKDWGDASNIAVYTGFAATNGDIEVYSRVKSSLLVHVQNVFGACVMDTAAANYDGYGVVLMTAPDTWGLAWCQNAYRWGGIGSSATGPTAAADTWVEVRVGRTGSTIRGKIWADGTTEPDWMFSGTDTNVTNLRAAAYAIDSSQGPFTWDKIGIGTAGDPAPKGITVVTPNPVFINQTRVVNRR